MDIEFVLNFDPLFLFLRLLAQRVAAGTRTPEIRIAVQEAGRDYLTDMRGRFTREGDGSWKPLAKRTQEERAYLGFPPAHPILRRLGFLFGGLIPGNPGNLFEVYDQGIRMGYGGDFRHPGYITPSGKVIGGNVRLADIAKFHQFGTARMNRRQILAQLSDAALGQMGVRLTNGYRALIAQAVADAQPSPSTGAGALAA